MAALSEALVPDADTEALFEGVKDGSWYATKFETTPPVRRSAIGEHCDT